MVNKAEVMNLNGSLHYNTIQTTYQRHQRTDQTLQTRYTSIYYVYLQNLPRFSTNNYNALPVESEHGRTGL